MRNRVFMGLLAMSIVACNKEQKAEETPPPAATPAPPPAAIAPATTPEKAAEPAPEAPAAAPGAPEQPAVTAATAAAPAAPAPANAPAPSASAATADKRATAGSVSAAPVLRCCTALSEAAKNSTGHERNKYSAAAAVCKGLAAQIKAGDATATTVQATLRAQLQGVKSPKGC